MAKCKYCNEDGKKWYKDPESGRFSLLEEDGSYHRCQSFSSSRSSGPGPGSVYRGPDANLVQQPSSQAQPPQQQQQQQQHEPAIKALSDQIAQQGEQINKLVELYNDFMQNLIETTHAAKDASSNSRKVLLIADKSDQFLEQARIIDAKVDRLVASYITHNLNQTTEEEKRAQQELEYDKDKEDGLFRDG